MLKVDALALDEMELSYPGVKKSILAFEAASLPACPSCTSDDTAVSQVGVVGRSITIAAATSKFKLMANGPTPGRHFCNTCAKFF